MAVGNPFPSKDFKIQVASAAVPATFKDVGGMRTWSADGNEDISETDVFHQTDPIQNYGRERNTFSLSGLLTGPDDGQDIIQAAVAGRLTVILKVLWDGTNGFTVVARPNTRRGTGQAGNGFAEITWDFTLLPSTMTIAGTGPLI